MFNELSQSQTDHRQLHTEPFITVSFAQSLDGCLAAQAGEGTSLSGPESMQMTHELRAAHDAILVGIDTVLTDNPRLTVRLATGASPRPVILDRQLRLPLSSQLLKMGTHPLIISSERASAHRQKSLEDAGAEVVRLTEQPDGIALTPLMALLSHHRIRSVMVEGGGRVISSFLQQQLTHFMVMTIVPRMMGSADAIRYQLNQWNTVFPTTNAFALGRDIIVWGQPRWAAANDDVTPMSNERRTIL
jgi:3,4-dihydroxy 2-butanone 4-phosphate synthase/GTP cyclohydrolase II